MGRVKGVKNKPQIASKITQEERTRMIANLIVDRIFEEMQMGRLEQIIKQSKQHG